MSSVSGEDEETSWQENNEFYNWVRQNIIAFLLFLTKYAISYSLLQRFRRKYRDTSDSITSITEDEDEDLFGIDNLIIIVLCAAGLAMALAGFSLLPFTMIATELLHDDLHNRNYYLSWLNIKLLETLWNYTYIGCNIALFGLLPFAYFYNETDQQRTFFAKARDTLTIMSLVGLLMYAFIYVSKKILGIGNIDELVILNLLTCLGGAGICLKATPKGYIQIFSWIGRLPLRPNYRKSLKNHLIQNEMEIKVLQRRLENLEHGWKSNMDKMSRSTSIIPLSSHCSSSSDKLIIGQNIGANRREILTKLKKLEIERRQTQLDLDQSPLYRNITFVILLLLSHCILFLLLVHILWAMIKSLLVAEGQKDLHKLEAVFGKQTVSMFGKFGVLSDLGLIFYFTAATIIGVYSIKPFKRIRPRWGQMNVQHILSNVAVLLVISSSWPTLATILGLTRLTSAGPYDHFHKLNAGYWFAFAFRVGTLITSMLTDNETPLTALPITTTTISSNTSINTTSIDTKPTPLFFKLSKKEIETYIKNVKTIDYTIVESNFLECSEYVMKNILDWEKEDLEFTQCKDGITNMLIKCSNKKSQKSPVLIRTYGNKTEMIIDRNQEIMNMVALSKLGLAAPLWGRFNNGLVAGYIPGHVFTVEDLRDPHKSSLVAKNMGIWHVKRIYKDKEIKGINIDVLDEELISLEKELLKLNSPIVFSHNDLLNANIIYDNGLDKVTFIDYEYSNYGYAYFDIANHFNEFGEINELYRNVNKFSLASHLYWLCWALIQHHLSTLEFDYMNYALLRFNEYYKKKNEFLKL
ncbi:5553_t:CDS:2 [Diversispora eburnea]|uniref:5553_t:CDS:1 n=1 Tax=Diversispora eburnea TaxID=1213867 RepID=A0A9N8YKS8_9GLOM|nr:5553_t:CDS:2 [Diversispora eburnea]